MNVLGYSVFAVRLPAALCSIFSGAIFAALCWRLLFRGRLIALALFLALPLQFRYGLEARVYSQGLLFSLVSMWLFLWLVEHPSLRMTVAYAIVQLWGSDILSRLHAFPRWRRWCAAPPRRRCVM